MDTTTARITETTSHCAPIQPEWARIPDAIRFSGIGRSRLYQLIDEGKIRSVCLRERKKSRGIRLIHLPALDAYISSFEGNEKGQDNGNAKRNGRARQRHARS